MRSFLVLAVCVSVTAAAPAPADKDEPPAKKELFAKENWYKDQKGDEVTIAGVLQKLKGDGGVGAVQRFNPYYLTYTERQTVTVSVPVGGGKFVPETRIVEAKKERDIYVGGKNDILDGYVGKKVQFTGKVVDMELEGRSFHELWPARVELEPKMNDRKPEPIREGKKDADKSEAAMEMKIIAQGSWHAAGKDEPHQLVIRSAEELAKAAGLDKPEDEKTQKKATETVAKALKIDDIDWKKQMILVVSGGMKRTGGFKIEIGKIDVADNTMTVRWKLITPGPRSPVTATITHPAQTIVVERFEGKVLFDPPGAKDK
jgi:hypothetical protein